MPSPQCFLLLMKNCAYILSLVICGDVESNPGPTNEELLLQINTNVEILLQRTNGLEEKLEQQNARVTSSEGHIKYQTEAPLQRHVQTLELNIDDLESRERRNNLVINRVKETPNENPSSLNYAELKEISGNKLEVTIKSIWNVSIASENRMAAPNVQS